MTTGNKNRDKIPVLKIIFADVLICIVFLFVYVFAGAFSMEDNNATASATLILEICSLILIVVFLIGTVNAFWLLLSDLEGDKPANFIAVQTAVGICIAICCVNAIQHNQNIISAVEQENLEIEIQTVLDEYDLQLVRCASKVKGNGFRTVYTIDADGNYITVYLREDENNEDKYTVYTQRDGSYFLIEPGDE